MNALHYVVRRSAAAYEPFGRVRDVLQRSMWRAHSGSRPPPGVVKRELIRTMAGRHAIGVLVETGTYLGDTVWALRGAFRTIHSIELDARLHAFARERLGRLDHVHLHHGNSAHVLAGLLPAMTERCVFWLDGHYSGGNTARGPEDTPVKEELALILAHAIRDHVILIDDARCFQGTGGYPTVRELSDLVGERRPDAAVQIADDIIRIEPAATVGR
jgi:hypothetical protein